MAKQGVVDFLAKWAAKFASTGNGTITGLFMRESRQDIADSFLNKKDGLSETSVDVSGSSVVLDFDNSWKGVFKGSASFDTAKEIGLDNDDTAQEFVFAFEITNIAAELTLPSDFTMSDALWERSSDNVWSPLDIGKYLMKGEFIDSEWKVTISGPWT